MSSVIRKIKIAIAISTLALANLGLFAPPANACSSEVCEVINRVCNKARPGYDCLG